MRTGTPAPSRDDRIPSIDLGLLLHPLQSTEADRRAQMLERLAAACRTCGVFYVENHGVPEDLLDRAIATFDAFFDLPLAERMEIAAPPGQACGYEPLAARGRELNDSFNCVLGLEEMLPIGELPDPGPNRWPRRPAGFEAMVCETMGALHGLGVAVMSAIALSLALPAVHFAALSGSSHMGSIRARRYPPRREDEARLGTNSHVDGPPLALIIQNEVPGLETEIPGAGWAAIEPRPGAIVCQLGSLFARWTNDRFVPNRHRVVNDPARERRSIIYWFPILPEAVITCAPTCCGPDDPARHAPISYARYLTEWVQSFAYDR